MLTSNQQEIIKSTAPVLREYGTDITTRFYNLLFTNNPELLNIFNQANQKQGKQQRALANSIIAAAENIEQLEQIMPVVEQIAHKHRSIGILPEHYPLVGENLLQAIKDVLGDNATDEILNAWEAAYSIIADIFIQVEQNMYQQAEEQENGWQGYKPFYIDQIVIESDVITSFYLKPVDQKPLPTFEPGQYISVQLSIPGETYQHVRQYSLSDQPNQEYYRISIKREDENDPNGVVSNYLHHQAKEGDEVPITVPAGDFTVDLSDQQPLVLISGGVGITPMLSMLKTVTEKQPEREVTFIHAARNSDVHAFSQELSAIAKENNQVRLLTVYSDPTANDREQKLFDYEGKISLDWLKQELTSSNQVFYFCGPNTFMQTIHESLTEWGTPEDQIHFEFFGPKQELKSKTLV
ncbi:NO-inducible flavohemoprotein [Alkalibacillus aidingensis]|uniref:NO-inducible flavohemoprotein n=1 Tax=Alkalibacillus aidingensis TaxID=2747607 RepID=UPI001660140A|nr:NO-inducible flavohemoprotein [Alkalibacillus aidingensis]